MKKQIALILLLATVLTLFAGCAKLEQKKLVGTWEGQLDMTNALEGLEIQDFTVTVVYTFREDGTYTKQLDAASVEAAFQTLLDAMKEALDAMNPEQSVGVDPEALLDAAGLRLEEQLDSLLKSNKTEGKFYAKDGKLHMTETPEQEINENLYDTYTLEGDVLTLTAAYGDEADATDLLSAVYPVILKKASQ